jgi:hypothetical protein
MVRRGDVTTHTAIPCADRSPGSVRSFPSSRLPVRGVHRPPDPPDLAPATPVGSSLASLGSATPLGSARPLSSSAQRGL